MSKPYFNRAVLGVQKKKKWELNYQRYRVGGTRQI